jgi:hypothetical protein
MQEWYQSEPASDEVWAVAEVYKTDPKVDDMGLRTEGGLSLSPMGRQGVAEGRSFLVLSTTRLMILGMQRPVDMLMEDLEGSKGVAIARGRDS